MNYSAQISIVISVSHVTLKSFFRVQLYYSIYVQIAWIVKGEVGCYFGVLDLIDFSVFSRQ